MKKIFIILIIIAVFALTLSLAKNIVSRNIIIGAVKHLTGLEAFSVEDMKVGIFTTLIDIRGLKIYNPEGFSDEIMAYFPQVYIDYGLGPLLKGKIYFSDMKLHLNELIIVKNAKGLLNISSIKTVKSAEDKKPKERAESKPVQIDSLRLRIGNVVYKDYSQGPLPQVHQFNIDLDESYENITDMDALVNIIIVKALRKTAIDRLANFDLKLITAKLPSGLKEGAQLVTKSAAEVKKIAQESVGSAAKTIKDATKSLFKLPAEEKK